MSKVLRNHPKVSSVSDERGNGDGYFCYLVPGWKFDGEVHFVHEQTVSKCLRALRHDLRPCDCQECRDAKERKS